MDERKRVAEMGVRVDQAGEQREAAEIDRVGATSRIGPDPLDHTAADRQRVAFHGLASGPVDQRRAC